MALRKNVFVAALALIGVLALVSGVGAQPIEIDYWGVWGGVSFPVEMEIIEEFNRQYEGRIRVTGVEVPEGVDAKLATAVAGGAPPAVAKVDRFRVGSFASAGLIQPIDDLIARDAYHFDQHYPATREETIYNGRIYGIPWNTDNRAMYYHIGLFQEAGLDVNAPPRTWEEVNEVARRIDRWEPDGRLSQVGFVPSWGNWYFVAWLWAAGGDLLDETNRKVIWNSPEGVRALQWMKDRLDYYGGVQALDAFGANFPRGAFLGERVGMMMDGSWALGSLKDLGIQQNFLVANPPRPAGLEDTPITWSGGFALAIPTGIRGEERDAAWEFIKFYTDHWAQTTFGSRTGQIPSLRSAATSAEFLSIDPLIYKFVDLMAYSRFRPVIPAGGELWSQYTDQIHALLNAGQMPVEQILDETARQAQILLDEAWARAEGRL